MLLSTIRLYDSTDPSSYVETRYLVVIPNENSSYLRTKFRDVRRSSIRRCLFSPVIVVLDAPFGFTDQLQLWIRKLVHIFDRRNPSESLERQKLRKQQMVSLELMKEDVGQL